MLSLRKIKIIQLNTVLLTFGLGIGQYSLATPVVNIHVVESLCKDQSEEMLIELGLAPNAWQALNSNSDGKFNIEGRWQTRNGDYIVECELPYETEAGLLELRLFRA